MSQDICVKDALTVLFILQALHESVRVELTFESTTKVCPLPGLAFGLPPRVWLKLLKGLALLGMILNVDLRLLWVPTSSNIADAPSRSDALLSISPSFYLRVLWSNFVGFDGPPIECRLCSWAISAFSFLPFLLWVALLWMSPLSALLVGFDCLSALCHDLSFNGFVGGVGWCMCHFGPAFKFFPLHQTAFQT